jgi:hypothetical protein
MWRWVSHAPAHRTRAQIDGLVAGVRGRSSTVESWDVLLEASDPAPLMLLIDIGGVTFCDSSGLRSSRKPPSTARMSVDCFVSSELQEPFATRFGSANFRITSSASDYRVGVVRKQIRARASPGQPTARCPRRICRSVSQSGRAARHAGVVTIDDGHADALAARVRVALESADVSQFGELLDPNVRWGARRSPSVVSVTRRCAGLVWTRTSGGSTRTCCRCARPR